MAPCAKPAVTQEFAEICVCEVTNILHASIQEIRESLLGEAKKTPDKSLTFTFQAELSGIESVGSVVANSQMLGDRVASRLQTGMVIIFGTLYFRMMEVNIASITASPKTSDGIIIVLKLKLGQ